MVSTADLTDPRLDAETAAMKATRAATVVLPAVAIVAAALRAAGALLRPPWHDEYFTAWATALRPGDLLDALRLDSGPPLPYLLARLAAATGLAPLTAARAISVLAGVLAVLAVAAAARRAAGAGAGLWCAALLALHPLAVAWSSEGRGYALLLLAAALSWERLEALHESGRGAVGLAFAVALGCWSHALGLVLAGAVAVAAFTLSPRARRAALLGCGAGLASHLPWLSVALAQPRAATAWMAGAWSVLPPLDKVLAPIRLLPPAAAFGDSLDLPSAPLAAQIVAALLCLMLVLRARGVARPAVLTATPALGLALVAWAGVPYLFPGRSEALYLAPFLGVVAAAAWRSRWTRAAGALLIAAGAATTAAALAAWAAAPPTTEQRLAEAIRQRLPGGGTVVVGGHWRLGLWYHLGGATSPYALVNVPAEAVAHPGWTIDVASAVAVREVDALTDRLAIETAAGRPLAIVLTPGLTTAKPLAAMAQRLGLREVLRLTTAVVWASPEGAA
jgi:hypothetical protein